LPFLENIERIVLMSIKARFIQYLQSKYDSWNNAESSQLLHSLISDQLISETVLELPAQALKDIETEIAAYHQLRSWGADQLKDQYAAHGLPVPPNEAVCTSYDFHWTTDSELKLIEINTNAAFLALGTALYDFHNARHTFKADDIVNMFVQEAQLCGHDLKDLTIIDESPQTQRLYIEFLLYQKMMEKRGVKAEIKAVSEINSSENSDLIYNRYTDFYLNDQVKSKTIRELYKEGKINLSPNPYEYFLLADKQRMIDWQHQTDLPVPKSLLKTYDLGIAEREEIWAHRKKLFFKPKNSFGSKQAYKGAAVSHKTFDDFFGPSMIAQEYAQPAETDVHVGTETLKMKYDLRCYAYQGKLQIVIARLYQGQTTNLKTTGGGFTIVNFR
jgi:hypothetical protein